MPPNLHRIPPALTHNARTLRRDATFPERLLWSRLRNGKLAGLKFRRQCPIGPFVADFYCPESRLVVELDGRSHVGRETQDHDRTAYLNGLGLRVVRYSNDQVLRNLNAVVAAIAREAGLEI